MLAAAATIGIASYLHLDGRIPLGFTTISGEHFSRVSVPEAIIGAVLAAGAVVVTVAPRRARAVALGAVGFAVLGVLAGLGFALTSSSRGRSKSCSRITAAICRSSVGFQITRCSMRMSRPRGCSWRAGRPRTG
jgi:hypothetical protein